MATIKSILKKIGEPHLQLYRGDGYHYFVYDDEKNNIYDTESVYVMYLNSYSEQRWISDGKEFVERVKKEYDISS